MKILELRHFSIKTTEASYTISKHFNCNTVNYKKFLINKQNGKHIQLKLYRQFTFQNNEINLKIFVLIFFLYCWILSSGSMFVDDGLYRASTDVVMATCPPRRHASVATPAPISLATLSCNFVHHLAVINPSPIQLGHWLI